MFAELLLEALDSAVWAICSFSFVRSVSFPLRSFSNLAVRKRGVSSSFSVVASSASSYAAVMR